MWARVVEIVLAFWLALSPLIFLYPQKEAVYWISDEVSACLILLFALLSFCPSFSRMHLLTLGVALWLWGFGYRTFPSMASPFQENSVLVGLLLLMLAVVPSRSHLPPTSWREFDGDQDNL